MANDVDQNDQKPCPDCGLSHSPGQFSSACTANGALRSMATADKEVISFAPEDPLSSPETLPSNRSSQQKRLSPISIQQEESDDFEPTVRSPISSSRSDSAKPEDLVGETLSDRYSLLEIIGKGGMSAVYKVKDLKLNKYLAVKILLPHLMANPISHQRFQVEAQAASSLSHPNLIVTHDFGITDQGRPYLVMELLDGRSLSDILKSDKRLSLDRAVPIFIQICDALAHAHGKGVLHRDLKPSNVMVSTTDNGIDFVRLLDFGIAKVLPQDGAESIGLTQTGEVFGSPHYMSPEQCQGARLDGRSDLYSMGCLMYESLSGRPPFVGENVMETLLMQINDTPPDFKTIDPSLNIPHQMELMVFKALAKNPDDRYESAATLSEALRAYEQNVTVLLLKNIQNRWQMVKLKVRPFKEREKKMLVFGAIVTVLFLVVASQLLSSYWNINTPDISSSNKAFMPEPAIKPSTRLPQEPLFMRDLEIQERMLRENPNSAIYDDYIRSVQAMASSYAGEGHFKEAVECYRRLLALMEKNDGATSTPTSITKERLADCIFKLAQYSEATALYTDLLNNAHGAGEEFRNYTTELRLKRATSLYAQNRITDAAPDFQRALRSLTESQQTGGADYAVTCARLAECYRNRHLWSDAIRYYDLADNAYKQLLQDGSYFANNNRCEVRSALVDFYRAFCFYELDNLEAAAKAYKTAIPRLKRLSGPAQELTVAALMQYADIQWRQGKFLDAVGTRLKARDMHKLLNE